MSVNYLKITPQNCGSFSTIFAEAGYKACDYSVGCTYIWRDFFQYEYRYSNGFLILRGIRDEYPFYLCPIGDGNLSAVLDELKKETLDAGVPLLLAAVPARHLAELEKDPHYQSVINNRDWFDYVYLASDLAMLPGKNFHGQKNHLNYFYKNNEVEIFPITAENAPRIKRFLTHLDVKENEKEEVRDYETKRVDCLLSHMDELRQKGYFITAGGKVVAFTIGEVVGDTLFVHIEKADRDYRGAYIAMCNAFVKQMVEQFNVTYVNREDDLGLPGLRKAKNDLHPIHLVEKPNIILSNNSIALARWSSLSKLYEI